MISSSQNNGLVRVAALVMGGFIAWSSPLSCITARANLISVNDPIFGPNSVVEDTATGLEWLELTATVGYSYNQIQADLTTTPFSGWQIATESQADTLILDAGPYLGNIVFDNYIPGFAPTLETLTALLGNTYSRIQYLFPGIDGFAGFVNAAPDEDSGSRDVLTMYESSNVWYNFTDPAISFDVNDAVQYVGTFLEREIPPPTIIPPAPASPPVPMSAPTALFLLLSGLIVYMGLARLKLRASHRSLVHFPL